jgi:hypothetical protein
VLSSSALLAQKAQLIKFTLLKDMILIEKPGIFFEAYLVVTKLCLPPLGLSRGYNIIPTHPWAYLVLSRSSSDPEFSMIA